MEKKETIKSVTFIISGALLQIFNGIGGNWAASLAAIFGLVLFFMGLKKLSEGVDDAGKSAIKLLVISAIVGIVGLVFGIIPLLGLVAPIIFIVAFVLELIGFIKLKSSATIGESGKSGVTLLLIAMGLAILESILSIVPFLGAVVGSILSLAAIILVFFGWLKIQEGIMDNIK